MRKPDQFCQPRESHLIGLCRLQYRRAQAIAQQGGDGLFAQMPYSQQLLQRRDGAPGGYQMLRPRCLFEHGTQVSQGFVSLRVFHRQFTFWRKSPAPFADGKTLASWRWCASSSRRARRVTSIGR
ncbi:MAG: hypothetical protein MUO64_22340 [Anaerolineales bacterium]|nr:hypothetical protein [Anaerolineales bacterium]